MDAGLALSILQWVAVVVLYLGLAAVLKETRALRDQVSRLRGQLATTGVADDSAVADPLPEEVSGGRDGLVVMADTTCPSCALVLERLTSLRNAITAPVTLLTWESRDQWSGLDPMFRVVRNEQAWAQLAHLTPPVLLHVAASGSVRSLHLPAVADDVDAALTTWGALAPVSEREHS